MDTRELAKVDLNLLISLQVLLEERSVSRAAERLFITQPAMSKTLSRLRQLFDDPLFTRSSHGMRPTPRARELAGDLAGILGDINRLVSDNEFDPASFNGEVTLALSEYIGITLLPELTRRLQARAPQLSLRVITRVENQLEQLALGNLDFAVHMRQAHYGDDFRVQLLGSSQVAVLLRTDHPLTAGAFDMEQLLGYPVIRIYIPDWTELEVQQNTDLLGRLAAPEQGSLEISHLMTALEVLRSTDYYMLGPTYLLQNEELSRGITALPMPDWEDYALEYVLVGHNRTVNSPLHNWLWEEITGTIRELRAHQPHKLRKRVAAGST